MDIDIRKVKPGNLSQLQTISRQTFIETFGDKNTPENMKKYLDESFSEEKLSYELEETDSQFYFATHNNEVIGYLKINSGYVQTEIRDSNALEIERIYVLKKYHGKKVGQTLYDKALQIALKTNANYLWLGVWEKNDRAMNFYRKNGFAEFDKHIFKLGNERQTDIMMKLKLRPII